MSPTSMNHKLDFILSSSTDLLRLEWDTGIPQNLYEWKLTLQSSRGDGNRHPGIPHRWNKYLWDSHTNAAPFDVAFVLSCKHCMGHYHGRVAVDVTALRHLWQHLPELGLVVLACVPVCAVLYGSYCCGCSLST